MPPACRVGPFLAAWDGDTRSRLDWGSGQGLAGSREAQCLCGWPASLSLNCSSKKGFQESLQSAPAQQQWGQPPRDPRVCLFGGHRTVCRVRS